MLRRALSTTSKLRCVLNAARVDFDGRINFEKLSPPTSACTRLARRPRVTLRAKSHDIVMNKEMPLRSDLIRTFPPSVKLICEMGTGYNQLAIWLHAKARWALAW